MKIEISPDVVLCDCFIVIIIIIMCFLVCFRVRCGDFVSTVDE